MISHSRGGSKHQDSAERSALGHSGPWKIFRDPIIEKKKKRTGERERERERALKSPNK